VINHYTEYSQQRVQTLEQQYLDRCLKLNKNSFNHKLKTTDDFHSQSHYLVHVYKTIRQL